MKLVAVILLTSLLYGSAAHGADIPVCDAADTSCLIRQSLTLKYRVNSLEKENQILRRNLDEEIKRGDSGPKFFICGLLAGAVFVGLGATLAIKMIKANQ